MNTQDCLDNLDKTLQAEGVSDEERYSRVQALGEVIASTEKLMQRLRKPKRPARQIKLSLAIEMAVWALAFGWVGGILTLHHYQTQQ